MQGVEVNIQLTPNPNAVKFTLDRSTTGGVLKTYRTPSEASEHPAASGLFAIDGVVGVFMTANFISVQKADDRDWEDIVPRATEVIESSFG